MALIDNYPQGAPCWFELGTTDQASAKEFYTQLFGWTIVDNPMGPDMVYTMFKLDGRDVAACYTLPAELRSQGIPPHWNIYFAAKSADEAAAKVTELGGSIIQPPFDVMEFGRMSICKDPGNAMFSIWQPNRHAGAGVYGQDNAPCWAELATWDTQKATDFYTGVFGWQTKGSANMSTYVEFSVDGMPRGGLLPMDENWKGIPSHWGYYIMVADVDATVAKLKELGGVVRHGPFDAPGVGRMAMLADPQGAGFSIIKLAHPM